MSEYAKRTVNHSQQNKRRYGSPMHGALGSPLLNQQTFFERPSWCRQVPLVLFVQYQGLLHKRSVRLMALSSQDPQILDLSLPCCSQVEPVSTSFGHQGAQCVWSFVLPCVHVLTTSGASKNKSHTSIYLRTLPNRPAAPYTSKGISIAQVTSTFYHC